MPDRAPASLMQLDLTALRRYAARRGLGAPLLLFLAGHRPLAFAAGQMLHLAAPLGVLAGWSGPARWAAALSDPDAAAHLEAALRPGAEEGPHAP